MLKVIRDVLGGGALTFLACTSFAQQPAKTSVAFHIESQLLPDALNAWAQQAGMQIVWRANATGSQQLAPRVMGAFAPHSALQALLRGSGLTYSLVDDETVAIRPEQKAGVKRIAVVTADESPSAAEHVDSPTSRTEKSLEHSQAARIGPAEEADQSRDSEALEEVVVTGSHIRGAPSAGSKVVVIDRLYIERSGYATVQDVIKTLPQNFGGGVGEVQSGTSIDTTAGNFNSGTAVNLRGLGADSTLVLIDGRRQPSSGTNGAFVDISSIAASAVDRVEILTDGASAIYGSDAIGGVVNIKLRRDFAGAETRARFGSYAGDANELQISQLLGQRWDSGNVLVGYQFQDRDSLSKAERAPTSTDDLRRYGGSDFRGSSSNPGNILHPATGLPAFSIPSHQDGTSLAPEDLLPQVVNYHDSSEQSDLLPKQRMKSIFFNANQKVGDRIELFGEGRYGTRHTVQRQSGAIGFGSIVVPSENPFFVDPFGGSESVQVAYNFLDDLGPVTAEGTVETWSASTGLTAELSSSWRLVLAGSYGTERTNSEIRNLIDSTALEAALADPDPQTAFNPFGDGTFTNAGTLQKIRATQVARGRSHIRTVGLTADGAAATLPGGAIRLAVGFDHRSEDIGGSESFAGSPPTSKFLDRKINAVFAELAVPLVGLGNETIGLRQLDLSVAGRYEDYSDFGSTFNPKVGVNWRPAQSLGIRATWGTSFKAPRLIQLSAGPGNNFDFVTPVVSPTGPVVALVRFGNNTELTEETARVWTLGFDWEPLIIAGLKTSLTYFHIDYRDRIAQPGPSADPTSALLQPDIWSSIITLVPSQAQVAAVCNSPTYVLDVESCLSSQPAALIDARLRNLATVNVRGIDFDLDYPRALGSGTLALGFRGTYTLAFDRAITSTSAAQSLVDTVGNIPAVRLHGEVSWDYRQLHATAAANYTDRYRDDISIPNREIDSWTTFDVSASYDFSGNNRLLRDFRLTASVINIFSTSPPFANVGNVGFALGYDPSNANLYDRIVGLQMSKIW